MSPPVHSSASISILLLLALGASSAAVQNSNRPNQDTITLESHLVLLNVAVTDPSGQYSNGLGRDDFMIYENGEPQRIADFGTEETSFAAAILLDVSGSQDHMVRIGRAVARQFASRLRPDDVFAVYAFASKVARVQDFGSQQELEEVIWGIKPEGLTALYDAVELAARELGQRPEKRRALLVLSDGDDNASGKTRETALRAALDACVSIYAVDLVDENTPNARVGMARNTLKSFAEKTGGRYLGDHGGGDLFNALRQIVEELSHQYTLGYYPKSDRHDGKWRSIEVRMARPRIEARTRQGYYARK